MTSPTATELTQVLAAPGLEGLVVAETSIGDVRGLEGFYHYRQYSAVELAADRTFADVVELLFTGATAESGRKWHALAARPLPAALAAILPQIAADGHAARGPAECGLAARSRARLEADSRHPIRGALAKHDSFARSFRRF